MKPHEETWHWEKNISGYPETSLVNETGKCILAVYVSHGGGQLPDDAHSKLLFQAPAMARKLKSVLEWVDSLDLEKRAPPAAIEEFYEAWDILRAAGVLP